MVSRMCDHLFLKQWIFILCPSANTWQFKNIKLLSKQVFACSEHFLDIKPTERNPILVMLFLHLQDIKRNTFQKLSVSLMFLNRQVLTPGHTDSFWKVFRFMSWRCRNSITGIGFLSVGFPSKKCSEQANTCLERDFLFKVFAHCNVYPQLISKPWALPLEVTCCVGHNTRER
jgi:hypothetical protein